MTILSNMAISLFSAFWPSPPSSSSEYYRDRARGASRPSVPSQHGSFNAVFGQQLRRLIPPLRTDGVEHAQVRRPIGRAAAGIVMLVLVRGLFADLRRDFDQVAAGRFHFELNVGRLEERLHQDKGFARGPAHREQAVIAHDQRAVLA